MKNLSLILYFLLVFIVVACTKQVGQMKQTEAHSNRYFSKTNIGNFVEGNRYHYTFYNNNSKEYTFRQLEKKDIDNYYLRGTFIMFKDSTNFLIYNSELCGNSCFYSIYGTYYLPTSSHLILVLDSTVYGGTCGVRETENENKRKEICKIVRTKNDTIIQLRQSVSNMLYK